MDRKQERMKKEERERENVFLLDNGRLLLEERIASCDGRTNPIRNFSAKQLIKATNNFDSHHRVSEEAYFIFYKGSLEERPILVKKYKDAHRTGKSLHIRDIVIGSQMSNHKNVLKLLGCCLEFKVVALVHEYAGDGVLEDHMYGSRRDGSSLSWKSRIRIAKEKSNSITYLHTAFPRPIIYRGLKPRVVYLDEHGVAKLSEFSLSISIPDGESRVQDDLAGTVGYIDPEYSLTGFVTEKADVYSFGKLLLELLTAQRHFDFTRADNLVLMEYVKDNVDKGRLKDIVDPRILGEGGGIEQERQWKAFVELALRCIPPTGEDRPTMIDVAKELRRIEQSMVVLPC